MNMILQDGLRLSIKFTNQPEHELDADTQEDKNKVNLFQHVHCMVLWGQLVYIYASVPAQGFMQDFSLVDI